MLPHPFAEIKSVFTFNFRFMCISLPLKMISSHQAGSVPSDINEGSLVLRLDVQQVQDSLFFLVPPSPRKKVLFVNMHATERSVRVFHRFNAPKRSQL